MRLLAALAICLLLPAARASEEEIATPHRISISADTGKAFGEVHATLEAHRDRGRMLKSITLTIDGKAHAVPKVLFQDLAHPLLTTAEFRHEGGRGGGGPWLYLVFRLGEPGVEARLHPRVYIRFRDGKFHERSIVVPTR